MGLRVADGLLSRLIRTIDINGNGTIEFDEFCYMMFCLRRRHAGDVSDNPGTKSSVWAELDISAIRSSTEHSHKRGDVDSRMTKSVSHLHQTVDDDNSVSSRRSARSRGSIAESIRNLARVFTPRKASSVDPVALNEAVTSKADIGAALFALSEGHYVASREVAIAERMLPAPYHSSDRESEDNSFKTKQSGSRLSCIPFSLSSRRSSASSGSVAPAADNSTYEEENNDSAVSGSMRWDLISPESCDEVNEDIPLICPDSARPI